MRLIPLLLLIFSHSVAALDARDRQVWLTALDVYRGDGQEVLAVVSDRTISASFLPHPGTMKGMEAFPHALVERLDEAAEQRQSLIGLCEGVPMCAVLTPDIQQAFRDHGARRRAEALKSEEKLPRGWNPFWEAMQERFPTAAGLIRLSPVAYSDDGKTAVVAAIWTGPRNQGGSQLVLMDDTGFGWTIRAVAEGDLAL